MRRVVMSNIKTVDTSTLTGNGARQYQDYPYFFFVYVGDKANNRTLVSNGYTFIGSMNWGISNTYPDKSMLYADKYVYFRDDSIAENIQAFKDRHIFLTYETVTSRRCLPVTYKAQQLVMNGDFSDGLSRWGLATNTVANITSEGLTVENLNNYQYCTQSFRLNTEHKYCALAMVKGYAPFIASARVSYTTDTGPVRVDADVWTIVGCIAYDLTRESVSFSVRGGTSTETKVSIRWCSLIDLTALYGAGNEPTSVETFLSQHPEYNSYVPFYDGKITQRRIIETKAKSVDLGTLDWTYFDDYQGDSRYYSESLKQTAMPKGKMQYNKYFITEGVSGWGTTEGSFLSNIGVLEIQTNRFKGLSAEEFKQAMQGVILTYETQ